MSGADLKIGVVADIHHGADRGTKLGSQARPLLQGFLAACAAEGADFVVDLGDRVNNAAFRGHDDDRERDLAETRAVGELFSAAAVPRHHLTGNHDVLCLDREEIAAALGAPVGSRVERIKGVDLILWDACVEPFEGAVRFGDEDLSWLESALASSAGPAVICTHIPFDDGSMVGNPYFETRYRSYATYANGAGARALVEASGKVVLCLAGHTHWFALNVIRGVPYLTVPSLTEGGEMPGRAEGSYAIVEVGDRVSIRIGGTRDLRLSLPLVSRRLPSSIGSKPASR